MACGLISQRARTVLGFTIRFVFCPLLRLAFCVVFGWVYRDGS